eukprot:165953-Prymnesium_polylepis.1
MLYATLSDRLFPSVLGPAMSRHSKNSALFTAHVYGSYESCPLESAQSRSISTNSMMCTTTEAETAQVASAGVTAVAGSAAATAAATEVEVRAAAATEEEAMEEAATEAATEAADERSVPA